MSDVVDHPCKGMTKAQLAAFERIAINLPPACSERTLDALLRAGVILRGEDERKRDALGVYKVATYYVPLPIHAQWCAWCDQQIKELAPHG